MIRIRHHRLWRPAVKAASVLGAALLLAAGGGPGAPVANAVGEAISGSGSTWSFPMVNQWRADVAATGTNVNISQGGSSLGRSQFASFVTDFGDSDIAYQGEDPLTHTIDNSDLRPYAYIPIIAGGTALMYHLEKGGQLVKNMRLSDLTVAKIFTGVINKWDDPAITADMNGQALPPKPIQVIVNSQGAGTSYQFTDWLSKRHGDLWQRFAGSNVPTSYYPRNAPNFSGQGGDDRIAATIEGPNADGAISFVQYSYPYVKNWPVAKVKNAAGYYAMPTPGNVAYALKSAHIETQNHDPKVYLTQQLQDVYTADDPRVYPLSSYSYMIIPIGLQDRHTSAGKARTFANFSYYALCDGQSKAKPLGYSPLPYNLVTAAFEQVPKFSSMDPSFHSNQDPKTCNNPTFDKNNLDRNVLAETNPQPPACDREGQGPCGTNDPNSGAGAGAGGSGGDGANGGAGSNGANANPNTTNPNAPTGNGDNPSNASTADAGSGAGAGTGGNTAGTGSSSAGSTTSELAAFRSDDMTTVMGVLAAIELVVVLLVPAFVGRALARRREQRGGNS